MATAGQDRTRKQITQAKSIDKILAEAYAKSAANTAKQHPGNARMQKIARDLAAEAAKK